MLRMTHQDAIPQAARLAIVLEPELRKQYMAYVTPRAMLLWLLGISGVTVAVWFATMQAPLCRSR
jgi:cell division septal protein FtsQ